MALAAEDAFLIVLVIVSAVVGILYNKKMHREEEYENIQQFVRDNLDVLGISNKGHSIDERKRYLVSFFPVGY